MGYAWLWLTAVWHFWYTTSFVWAWSSLFSVLRFRSVQNAGHAVALGCGTFTASDPSCSLSGLNVGDSMFWTSMHGASQGWWGRRTPLTQLTYSSQVSRNRYKHDGRVQEVLRGNIPYRFELNAPTEISRHEMTASMMRRYSMCRCQTHTSGAVISCISTWQPCVVYFLFSSSTKHLLHSLQFCELNFYSTFSSSAGPFIYIHSLFCLL